MISYSPTSLQLERTPEVTNFLAAVSSVISLFGLSTSSSIIMPDTDIVNCYTPWKTLSHLDHKFWATANGFSIIKGSYTTPASSNPIEYDHMVVMRLGAASFLETISEYGECTGKLLLQLGVNPPDYSISKSVRTHRPADPQITSILSKLLVPKVLTFFELSKSQS